MGRTAWRRVPQVVRPLVRAEDFAFLKSLTLEVEYMRADDAKKRTLDCAVVGEALRRDYCRHFFNQGQVVFKSFSFPDAVPLRFAVCNVEGLSAHLVAAGARARAVFAAQCAGMRACGCAGVRGQTVLRLCAAAFALAVQVPTKQAAAWRAVFCSQRRRFNLSRKKASRLNWKTQTAARPTCLQCRSCLLSAWASEAWTGNLPRYSAGLLRAACFRQSAFSFALPLLLLFCAAAAASLFFCARVTCCDVCNTRARRASYLKKLGLSHVKGLLMYGPPGCGKTLVARQISKVLKAHAPKIVNGPEIFDRFVGGSEENIRRLFADAEREYADAGDASQLHVIIFDEIDAICKKRGTTSGSTGVNDSVVNQLLSKIDGVDALNNVLVIGMTNRPDMIDEALTRPGRLEVKIEIGLPDTHGRVQILNIHTEKFVKHGLMGEASFPFQAVLFFRLHPVPSASCFRAVP